jgi:hypothetical protein
MFGKTIKSKIVFCAVAAGISAIAVLTAQNTAAVFRSDIEPGLPKPWTFEPKGTGNGRFSFIVMGDRTGMAWPGKMDEVVAKINARKSAPGDEPKFSIITGDLIEGYNRDLPRLNNMWNEVDRSFGALRIPLFRAPGNHDISNLVMQSVFEARYGRTYYHFLYEGALFLVLNTEDPPPPSTVESENTVDQAMKEVAALAKIDPRHALPERFPNMCDAEGTHNRNGQTQAPRNLIGDEQTAYFESVLARYPKVSWTFLFMHQPAWRGAGSPNFAKLQAKLAGRKHTVFAGHFHQYNHEELRGAAYYITGPTAAISRCPSDKNGSNQLLNIHFDGQSVTVEREFVE